MALAPTPLALENRASAAGLAASCARLWHLFSLDAPTVAALWAWGMAAAFQLRLPWSAPLLLALGTWLLYIADRILDGMGRHGFDLGLRDRHYFYMRHRCGFLIAGACGALLLLWLIATRMTAAAFHEDLMLFALALVYFGLIHLCGPAVERWFPKEMAVGIVFASATAVPAWSRLAGHRLQLFPLVILFATLCWMNCAAIEKWETGKWESKPSHPAPHATTQWLQQRLQAISILLTAAATLGAVVTILLGFPLRTTTLYAACAVSALLLAGLDRADLSATQLRVAADAVLLTPLLLTFVA